MRDFRIPLFLSTVAQLALACSGIQLVLGEVPDGFTSLFDGKTLTHWQGLAGNPVSRATMTAEELATAQQVADTQVREHWQVVDGAIHFDGESKNHLNLSTVKDYADFELHVDWKISEGGDSGIYLRGTPQINLWDTEFEAYRKNENFRGSGNLWNNKKHERYPLVKADNAVGEWNKFTIRLVGERVFIKLNGKIVANNFVMENYWQREKPLYRTGAIELQDHGDPLWFRNISVREIPADEANQILRELDDEGFESVFNGNGKKGKSFPT